MMLQRLVLLLLLGSLSLQAGPESLQVYIQTGLQGNLALQRESFFLEESLAALAEARGRFLPAISIEARYSRADGGRGIDIPVGSLLNGVYGTLNQLIGETRFPQIADQTIPFLREEEQESKVRLVQPVFQAGIYHSYQSRKNLAGAQQAQRQVFMRQLVSDIQVAYYSWQKALAVERVLLSTRELLEENLRVSSSLFRNGSATEDVVLRARAEISDLEQQIAGGSRNRTLAAHYFNFLLNRPLDSPISESAEAPTSAPSPLPRETPIASILAQREELRQLDLSISAAHHGVRASQSAFLPGISLVFDYGFQGADYRFNTRNDYWMGSLVLSWNLFNGFQDRARVKQAALKQQSLQTLKAETDQRIRLQTEEAVCNLEVADKAIVSAREQEESVSRSFSIVDKKYRNGMAPQIEFLEARNALTRAQLNLAITQFDRLIRLAEYERVSAAYPLPGADEQ